MHLCYGMRGRKLKERESALSYLCCVQMETEGERERERIKKRERVRERKKLSSSRSCVGGREKKRRSLPNITFVVVDPRERERERDSFHICCPWLSSFFFCSEQTCPDEQTDRQTLLTHDVFFVYLCWMRIRACS